MKKVEILNNDRDDEKQIDINDKITLDRHTLNCVVKALDNSIIELDKTIQNITGYCNQHNADNVHSNLTIGMEKIKGIRDAYKYLL